MHVHITSADGEAKFWLEPVVALADFEGYSKKQFNELHELVVSNATEFTDTWRRYFS